MTLLLTAAVAVSSPACAEKDRPQRTLVLQDESAAAQNDPNAIFSALDKFYRLYGASGGFSKAEANNIFLKYEKKINDLTGVYRIPRKDAVDLMFELFDAEGSKKLGINEARAAYEGPLFLVQWTRQGPIHHDELLEKLKKTHPDVPVSTVESLVSTLMRFDDRAVGGDGDSSLNFWESIVPSLVILANSNDMFSRRLAAYENSKLFEERVIARLMWKKLKEQVFTELDVRSLDELSPEHLRLEWEILSLRYALVQRRQKAGGELESVHPFLKALYDSKSAGAVKDVRLVAWDSFNIETDLAYWRHVRSVLGEPSNATLSENPLLLAQVMQIFPAVGGNMMAVSGSRRRDFWASLQTFDRPDYGGNGDHQLDAGELTLAFAWVWALDNMYSAFGKPDTDSRYPKLTEAEVEQGLQLMGVHDPRLLKWIFMGFRDRLESVDTNVKGATRLMGGDERLGIEPYEFYQKVLRVLPQFMAKPRDPGSKSSENLRPAEIPLHMGRH